MRGGLIAVLLIALSASSTWLGEGTAAAQRRGHSRAELPAPSIGLPLPSIGLPLPTIGLPLPPMGLPPRNVAPSILNSSRGDRLPPRGDGRVNGRSRHLGSSVILFVPAYGWPYVPDTLLPGTPGPSLPSPPSPPQAATGRLHLDLQPGVDPQIYVDGYFVGLMSDVGGELTLPIGAYTLDLHEEGYESLRVDVRITADGLITYHGELKPLAGPFAPVAPAPSPRDVPPAPSTIYMIPGCYVGNIPPRDASLPAGCDAGDAIAFPSRP